MADLRSFIGSPCPLCAQDILQGAPSRARMPPGNYLFCPACETEHTLDMLVATKSRGGLFRRLFGRPNKA